MLHMRFRVVEGNDVRFTHQASDVNILECVFPASDRVRKIVSELRKWLLRGMVLA